MTSSESQTPLGRRLKFWFQKLQDKSDFAHSLLPVAVVSTVEQFWGYYQHLRRPSDMEDHENLYLFVDGVQPLWEDAANKTGGALSILFQKDKTNRIWEDILLSFIDGNSEETKVINGIRLKIRKDVAAIEIWTKVPASDKERIFKVKKWFTDAAGIREDTPIDFTPFY